MPTGDDFSSPIVISGSGSVNVPISTATFDSTTPEPGTSAANQSNCETVWVKFTPSATGTLTFTASPNTYNAAVDFWYVDDLSALVAAADPIPNITTLGASTDIGMSNGVDYYLRFYPMTQGDLQDVTLDYSFAVRVSQMTLSISDTPLRTPGSLLISLGNGTPGDTINFWIQGQSSSFYTADLDDSGTMVNVSIPLPNLAAGTYTLQAFGTGSVVSADFTLVYSPITLDTFPSDATPSAPVTPGKWQYEDPATSTIYVFPYNPSAMGSPTMLRTFTTDVTTAPNGQSLTWEGAKIPKDWEFSGFLDTEAFYNALVDLAAKKSRVYIVDHHSRAWNVAVESVDFRAHKNPSNFWTFDYTVKTVIFSGPVDV